MVTRRSWHLFGAKNPARSGSSPAAASVGELTPAEFVARLDQLVAVYAAAMRPPAELLAGRRTIMAGHAGNPGFRALAVTDDGTGETVGFGYGFRALARTNMLHMLPLVRCPAMVVAGRHDQRKRPCCSGSKTR